MAESLINWDEINQKLRLFQQNKKVFKENIEPPKSGKIKEKDEEKKDNNLMLDFFSPEQKKHEDKEWKILTDKIKKQSEKLENKNKKEEKAVKNIHQKIKY